MYGTVAKMRIKPGALEHMEDWGPEDTAPRGAVAVYAFRMDADPNEVYMAAIFENKEAYIANANSPEQNERYEKMVKWLEGEPEWHDGEIVYSKGY